MKPGTCRRIALPSRPDTPAAPDRTRSRLGISDKAVYFGGSAVQLLTRSSTVPSCRRDMTSSSSALSAQEVRKNQYSSGARPDPTAFSGVQPNGQPTETNWLARSVAERSPLTEMLILVEGSSSKSPKEASPRPAEVGT